MVNEGVVRERDFGRPIFTDHPLWSTDIIDRCHSLTPVKIKWRWNCEFQLSK